MSASVRWTWWILSFISVLFIFSTYFFYKHKYIMMTWTTQWCGVIRKVFFFLISQNRNIIVLIQSDSSKMWSNLVCTPYSTFPKQTQWDIWDMYMYMNWWCMYERSLLEWMNLFAADSVDYKGKCVLCFAEWESERKGRRWLCPI